MNISMIKHVVTRNVGRGLLIAKKYSPEILMIVGSVSIVGGTVLACKATLKADAVLDETKENIDKIHMAKDIAKNDPEIKYTDVDYRKDLTVAYTHSVMGFVKLYGPAVTLGVAGFACILGAHGIMRRRNVALVAAYKAIEKSFSDYRSRVVKELGVDKDREFKYGIVKQSIVEVTTDAEGNVNRVRKEVEVIDPNGISQYARIFDDTNVNWDPTNSYNMLFLKCQQTIANDKLHARGHLFLNEVYELLGFEHTTAGAVVGWVDGLGDDFVDFGIFDTTVAGYVDDKANDTIGEQRRDFINGHKNAILLDFNVAGTIYDKI
jgi:hypothetical protein